jgi:cysteinyl-tRNA synthetase
VFEFVRQTGDWVRSGVGRDDLAVADAQLQTWLNDVLGFQWPRSASEADESKRDELIRILVDLRNDARQRKEFALGDTIRQRLSALGVELRDGPSGTTW